MNLKIVKLLDYDMGRINQVYIPQETNSDSSFIVLKNKLFKYEKNALIKKGTIALNNLQREFLSLNLDSILHCDFMQIKNVPFITLIKLSCEVINLGSHEISKKQSLMDLRVLI